MKQVVCFFCLILGFSVWSDLLILKAEQQSQNISQLKASGEYNKMYALAFISLVQSPEDTDLLLKTGEALLLKGYMLRARDIFKQVLDRKPDSSEAIAHLKEVSRLINTWESECENLESSLMMAPDNKKAYDRLIRMLLNTGEYSRASRKIQDFERAVDDPHLVNSVKQKYINEHLKLSGDAIKLTALALEKYNGGKVEEAHQLFQQALEKSQFNQTVYNRLSIILMKEKNFDGALLCLEEAFSVSPKKSSAFNAGNLALVIGLYDTAMEYYMKALDFVPNSPEVLFNMGVCLEKAGDRAGAAEFFKQAQELNPLLTFKDLDRIDIHINGFRLDVK